MTQVCFFLGAIGCLGGAIAVIALRNPFYSVLALIVHLISLAGLFLLLQGEFLAAAQVIVYAGAIMVLFVFAIMVLIPGKDETGPDPRRPYRLLALPVGAGLLVELAAIVASGNRGDVRPAAEPSGGVEAIGRLLFTDYLFPFELTSVLLLAAMVGVLLLARRRTG